LFHSKDKPVRFDQSSRVYSLVLLALTTFTALMLYFPGRSLWLVHGTLLVASFAIYIASVGWAIRRGSLTAPDGSDSSSSNDSDNTSDNENIDGDEVNDVTVERRNNAEGHGYGPF
jgi:hypothetical protein